MNYINTGAQSSRSHVSQTQPQVQRGWLGRAVDAVKEALTGATVSTQGVKRGPDRFERGARIDINRPRQLASLNSGCGSDNSRGTKSLAHLDCLTLPFLNDMSNGKYG